jgi:hypothetical protein
MHHDLAWWGFVLGVLALLLMLPASIFANILTPKLKNWWAERSVAATRKRIEKLEKELALCEPYPLLNELEDSVVKAVEGIGMLLALCLYFLAVILLTTTPMIRMIGPAVVVGPPALIFRAVTVLLSLIGAGASVASSLVFRKLGTAREKQSPSSREALRESIEKLKAKLAETQPSR